MIGRPIEAKRRDSRVSGIGIWIAGAVSFLFLSPVPHSAQSSLPNLRPHQPRDWSDRIVVSSVKDTRSDSSPLRDTDDLFVDFAVVNAGAGPVTEPIRVELIIDGRPARTFESERSSSIRPLMSDYFTSWSDYWIGRLSAGTHTLKIVVDSEDSVSESNERDNEYSRTVTVRQSSASGCFPLTTGVVPTGGRNHYAEPHVDLHRHDKPAQRPQPRVKILLTPPSDGPVVTVRPTSRAQKSNCLWGADLPGPGWRVG